MRHSWNEEGLCRRCGMYRKKRKVMLRRPVFGRRYRTFFEYWLNGEEHYVGPGRVPVCPAGDDA